MEPIEEDLIEFQVDREMTGLHAKIETLRSENEWLREEITRLQDLTFSREVITETRPVSYDLIGDLRGNFDAYPEILAAADEIERLRAGLLAHAEHEWVRGCDADAGSVDGCTCWIGAALNGDDCG